MEFVHVSTLDELKDGELKLVNVQGQAMVLARVGDTVYAADNRCPHMGANLSQGELHGTVITCPLHHSQFDLADGHVVQWTDWKGAKLAFGKMIHSPRPLKTYAVRIDGNNIMVAASGNVPAGAKA